MQGTTRRRDDQPAWVVLHTLGVLSLLGLALLGQVPAEVGGWLVPPAIPMAQGRARRVRSSPTRRGCTHPGRAAAGRAGWRALGDYLLASWRPVLLRSLLLWGLWEWSGRWGPRWLRLLPWALWLWQGVGVGWPHWRSRALWRCVHGGLWQAQRLLLVGYVLVGGQHQGAGHGPAWGLGAGCVVCARDEPWVEVECQPDGSYQATLCGHFTLAVAGDHPFRMRLLILFLGLLDGPGPQRGGRRTRDGRTPFVREMQLATWFGVPHPDISRWQRYWLSRDWANLLSLCSAEVLTAELVGRIVEVFATFPTWSQDQVYHYLRQQGVPVTAAQVAQAASQSGWQRLRQTLHERYELSASALRLRDEWPVGQLLTQIRTLLARGESAGGVPVEVRLPLADVLAVTQAAGVSAVPPSKALPWLLRVEHVLFGAWEPLTDGQVRCPTCGSTQVGRKSATPRLKQYYDETHQLRELAVYRYYCRNPQCVRGSFTNLPPGLTPYSRHRTEVRLRALQMYAWGYSTYRRTGAALGVSSLTAWRWVSAWGEALLPVAALFGVVKSSGVVGVDEKYVLVPKNRKPAGEMRRWMYVYLAVDVWTYDLLHIALYAYNDAESAQAFLLALRAKGYQPQVIVTDLRQDYGPVIAQVFPQAVHHLCLFHALQDVQKHIKAVYGPDYADQYPEAERLKQEIYTIFAATTLTLATERYTAVLALRAAYVQARPEATAIFDFLARHWPKLSNYLDASLIPATNNAVELVIRRFDQHYQNFCGFESPTDAQRYLAVFEKIYRFTPFSQDAQPRIRGQSPLQLAGYDVASLPMSTLCAGLSIVWPMQTTEVPDVPSQSR
jgi:Transposase IS66 family